MRADTRKHIFRLDKGVENPYVMINNSVLRDERLTWQARGLIAYLLSMRDDWTIVRSQLVKMAPNGKDSLKTIMDELKEIGYLVTRYTRTEEGKVSGYETIVFEDPKRGLEFEKEDCQSDNRPLETVGDGGTEPHAGNPHTVNPHAVNPSLRKTNKNNNTKNLSSSARDKKSKPKVSLEELSVEHIKDWLAEKRICGVYIHHDEHQILEKFKNYCLAKGKKYENYAAAYRNAFEWDSNQPKQSNPRNTTHQTSREEAIKEGIISNFKGAGGLRDIFEKHGCYEGDCPDG